MDVPEERASTLSSEDSADGARRSAWPRGAADGDGCGGRGRRHGGRVACHGRNWQPGQSCSALPRVATPAAGCPPHPSKSARRHNATPRQQTSKSCALSPAIGSLPFHTTRTRRGQRRGARRCVSVCSVRPPPPTGGRNRVSEARVLSTAGNRSAPLPMQPCGPFQPCGRFQPCRTVPTPRHRPNPAAVSKPLCARFQSLWARSTPRFKPADRFFKALCILFLKPADRFFPPSCPLPALRCPLPALRGPLFPRRSAPADRSTRSTE